LYYMNFEVRGKSTQILVVKTLLFLRLFETRICADSSSGSMTLRSGTHKFFFSRMLELSLLRPVLSSVGFPNFHIHGVCTSISCKENLFSPQISLKSLSHSQNKKTELKKEKRKKGKSIEKRKRKKRAPKVSYYKGMNIFREEKNISTSNLLV
jgi:hypothetical protein